MVGEDEEMEVVEEMKDIWKEWARRTVAHQGEGRVERKRLVMLVMTVAQKVAMTNPDQSDLAMGEARSAVVTRDRSWTQIPRNQTSPFPVLPQKTSGSG